MPELLNTGVGARADRLSERDCDINAFVDLVTRPTDLGDYPNADEVTDDVLIYDSVRLASVVDEPEARAEVQDELARALLTGPGIVVFAGAFTDAHAIDEITARYTEIIAAQRESGGSHGDHFAPPGANDRVWNALGKLAVAAPDLFVRYYSNDMVSLVSEAWLGPMYQVTSAINVVNPGGAAQNPHRDYHLGFMSADSAARFRAHVHRLSPALTLQGAVAHVDMPLASGPTTYLPYSQQFEAGYLAFNLPRFREYFAENRIQLPLRKGDAVFFNPALFHAAGHNVSTDIYRMANLLQISSAFGRSIDSVDREKLSAAVYPALVDYAARASARSVANVIAASAEGYAFPTNLDLDQPITGLAGETAAELMTRAVASGMDPARFTEELRALTHRHEA